MLASCADLLPIVKYFKLSQSNVVRVPGTIWVCFRRPAAQRKGRHSRFTRRESKLRVGFIAFNLPNTSGAVVVSPRGAPEKAIAEVVDKHRRLCHIAQA